MLANLKAARDKADAEEAASAPAPKASASKQGDLLSQLKGKYGDDEEDEEAAFAALTGSPRRGSPKATAAPSSVKKGKIGSFASDWEEPVHPLTDEEITSRMADRILRRRMADRDRAAAAVAVAAVAAERRKEEGETGPLNASLGASQGAAADGDGNHSVRVQESARKVFQAWRRPFQGQSPVQITKRLG